jgi:septal ring factor EnvC (AmiA/AmiB activator)
MNAFKVLAVLVVSLLACSCPAASALAQARPSAEAGQIAVLRKELQRQRKVQDQLRSDLQTTRTVVGDLNQRITMQRFFNQSLQHELASTKGLGAIIAAALGALLLIVAFRRGRPAAAAEDDLQRRLAALDQKLRDLSPR